MMSSTSYNLLSFRIYNRLLERCWKWNENGGKFTDPWRQFSAKIYLYWCVQYDDGRLKNTRKVALLQLTLGFWLTAAECANIARNECFCGTGSVFWLLRQSKLDWDLNILRTIWCACWMRNDSASSKSDAILSALPVGSGLIDLYSLELISHGDWTAGELILYQVNEEH